MSSHIAFLMCYNRKLSRYKPKYEFNDDFDFDDRDMEATFDEITQEEMRR
jgi:hypothetical protein